jgi:hypothetical protein
VGVGAPGFGVAGGMAFESEGLSMRHLALPRRFVGDDQQIHKVLWRRHSTTLPRPILTIRIDACRYNAVHGWPGIVSRLSRPENLPSTNMSKTTRPRRRWFHFSLRTLFIVMTLICVVLGLWITKSIRQRDAVAELHALGDGYEINYGRQEDENPWYLSVQAPSPGIVERLLGIDFVKPATRVWVFPSTGKSDLSKAAKVLAKLPSLERISFDCRGEDLTDDSLPALARVKRLRILDINFRDSNILTGVGFKSLATLPDLQELSLQSCKSLNDEGLAAICEIQTLRTLSLYAYGTELTNSGLAQLKRLRDLNSLRMELGNILGGGTTDAVLEDLQSLASLKQLSLSLSRPANRFAGLRHLAGLPALHDLEVQMPLHDDTEIADLPSLPRLSKLKVCFDGVHSGDEVIHNFSTFPNVRQLELHYLGAVSEVGMGDLVARFPRVESLHLGGLGSVNGGVSNLQAVDKLARLANLSDLSLEFATVITDRNSLAPFARLPQLAKLHVSFGPATVDLDMSQLARCRNLTELTISGSSAISDAGMADIARLTSLHKLTIWECSTISDAGLKHLAALKNLKELTIIPANSGQLSAPACAALKASLPGCRALSTSPIPLD